MTAELEARSVSLGGGDVEYRELGRPDAEPVVMLHGGGGFRDDRRAFSGLAEHFRVLIPSMPGFDGSSAGTAASTLDLADVMAAFISTVAGGQANVLGESFGGGVACWLAIRHPAVVTRLALAAPAGLRRDGGPSAAQLTPAQAAELLYGQAPTAQPSPAEAERRLKNRQQSARIGRARPGFDAELLAQLPRITAPTLVLWGTADRMISPDHAELFVGNIPGARLVAIDGGPHVLSAVVPDEFLAAVLEFFQARSPATA